MARDALRHTVRGGCAALACALLLGVPCARAGPALPAGEAAFGPRLAAAALERTRHAVRYDPAYRALAYPGGDVPDDRGVCTDVVIRAYRALGIDLQVDVHEEMGAAWDAFPDRWGLKRPDPNIDHRRVLNLEVLFARRGRVLPVTRNSADYAPGDLVTWRLGGRLPHIGIVTGRRSTTGRPLVVHNVGWGPRLDDVLFAYPLTGHYRYRGREGRGEERAPPPSP
jgi:uncharacterized protein YijF (DUF1287 family)